MNVNEVKIDIEKRTAKLWLPYFEAKSSQALLHLGKSEDIMVSRNGNQIEVFVNWDFGEIISDDVWDAFGSGSGMSIMDMLDEGQTRRQLQKELILESVKNLYPKVLTRLRENAKKNFFGGNDE